jgi:7,8-dihydro-6-hydroxymethylpterin-pyrophosphokinase
VLAPLAEIAPGLVLPGQQKTAAELLATLGQTGEIMKTEPLMNANGH